MLAAGALCEFAVLGDYSGQLGWLRIVLPAACGAAAIVLFVARRTRTRAVAIALGVGALLLGPAVWALDTLGYATAGTFPAGGPANLATLSSFGGPRGGRLGRALFAGPPGGAGGVVGGGGGGAPQALFGPGGGPSGARIAGGAPRFLGGQGFGGGTGGFGAGGVPSAVRSYVRAHGGGTIAVSSQSTAAEAIVTLHEDVAGIGGFSGRESDPSITWLSAEVASGRIRWVYGSDAGGGFVDGRPGASAALAAAAAACTPVKSVSTALYDCMGKAAALRASG